MSTYSTLARTARFGTTPIGGYEMRDVDDLLERAAVQLKAYEAGGRDAVLTAGDVTSAALPVRRFGMGYRTGEVDLLLDDLIAALQEFESRR